MPPLRSLILLIALSACASAQSRPVSTSWFRDIKVPSGGSLPIVTCTFCTVFVEGEVRQDVVTQWGDIEIRGTVGRDVVAVAGSIHLYSGAEVEGDAISVFGDTIVDDNARVHGEIIASLGRVNRSPNAPAPKAETSVAIPVLSALPARWRCTAILWFVGLAIALPLAVLSYGLLGRERLERMLSAAQESRRGTILIGTAIFTFFLAAFTLASQSANVNTLEPSLSVVFFLLLAPGYTAFSLWIGRRYAPSPITAVLLGTIFIISLQVIPIAGWILSFFLIILSFGVLPRALIATEG